MRHLALLAAAALVLAGVPALAAADITGEPELYASVEDNSLEPEEQRTLQLQLTNRGDVDSGSLTNPSLRERVTTARGLVVTVDDDDTPIDVRTGTQTVGSVAEGTTEPVSLPVVVDADAEPGEYTLEVDLRYRYTREIDDNDGDETQRTVSETIPVTVQVQPRARFEVTGVDSAARVDSTERLAVTVENVGAAPARESTLRAESPNAALTFDGSDSASREVGAWGPGETRTVAYEVTAGEDAEQQRYAVEFTVDYTDRDGASASSRALPVGVVPAPEQTFAVTGGDSTLRVDEEGTLRGTVTNTGEQTVGNAVVVFETDAETVTAIERERPVGDLAPGEASDFELPLEMASSAEAGPRQFEVSVRYRNSEGDRRTSDTADVRAEVAPEQRAFDLRVETEAVEAGSSTTVRVTVTNSGEQRLSDIDAKLFAEGPLSATDDEGFIAGLEPGESDTLTFGVSASGGALAKTYPLSMDFQYDDSDGDTLTSDTYRLGLEVTEPEDDGGVGLPVVGAVALVVLVVAGLGVRRLRN